MREFEFTKKFLIKKQFLGNFVLEINDKELITLMLLYQPKSKITELWRLLWININNYDELPHGTKLLMPSVINRLISLGFSEFSNEVNWIDLSFLIGLPRYAKMKNKALLNEILRIATLAQKENIQIIAIKGASEIFLESQFGMTRLNADIDLLVKQSDLKNFSSLLAEMGYILEFDSPNYLVPYRNQHSFKRRDNSIFKLDVHVALDRYLVNDNFTNIVWKDKVVYDKCPSLYFPSPEHRFIITLINAYRTSNWKSGSFLKYISDYYSIFPSLSNIELNFSKINSGTFLEIRNWTSQILEIGREVGIISIQKNIFSFENLILNSGTKPKSYFFFSKPLISFRISKRGLNLVMRIEFYFNLFYQLFCFVMFDKNGLLKILKFLYGFLLKAFSFVKLKYLFSFAGISNIEVDVNSESRVFWRV